MPISREPTALLFLPVWVDDHGEELLEDSFDNNVDDRAGFVVLCSWNAARCLQAKHGDFLVMFSLLGQSPSNTNP